MPTILEQTTIDPVTSSTVDPVALPTVTYDPVNRKICATVMASWNAIDGFIVQAPIIAIPKGGELFHWTVLWTIQSDGTLDSLSFSSPFEGIEVPTRDTTMPAGVGLLTSGQGPGSNQWQIAIDNRADSASPFNYTISLTGTPAAGTAQPQVKKHDPTIVVTLDPMT